ncbi:MAG: ATP synthase F1 subunit delta [Kofleriaceae bacterium]
MAAGSLARRYARAVFDLGVEHGNLDAIGRDLRGLAAVLKVSPDLGRVLSNPSLRRADRRRVLEALLGRLAVAPAVRNLVLLLLDRERIASLRDIARELDAMLEARAGRVTAQVTSAQPLTAAQLGALTAALEQLSGKKVEIVRSEDPTLLGGVVAKLGDVVYDGSLKTQLAGLREQAAK